MQLEQLLWENDKWIVTSSNENFSTPQLVIYFGANSNLENPNIWNSLRDRYPDSVIVGCSSAGEIIEDEVLDDSVVVTAIHFEKSEIKLANDSVSSAADSFEAGKRLGEELVGDELKGIWLISEGLNVNGSELVNGITSIIGDKCSISGGLAGDNDRFKITRVSANNIPKKNQIAAIVLH